MNPLENRPLRRLVWACSFLVLSALPAPTTLAANGDCSIPVTSGSLPKSSDCLHILKAGVGIVECDLCVCDTNGSQSLTSADALLCLKVSVGQEVPLACPPCGDCPGTVEWTTRSGYGAFCTGNSDCGIGICDQGSGRCRTASEQDIGWTGNGHDSDLDDGATLGVRVACQAGDAPCGECEIEGVDPSGGSCRCQNDTRTLCDEPYELDSDDCPACFGGAYVGRACTSDADCSAGSCTRRCQFDTSIVCTKNSDCPGNNCVASDRCDTGKACLSDLDCTGTCTAASLCQCYDAPPTPLSVTGVPFCLVPTLTADVSGTVDVDSGASSVVRHLRTLVYNGEKTTSPCPVCGGVCSNDAEERCLEDSECPGSGVCVLDPVDRDGHRGGVCQGQGVDGLPCDVQATSSSFPTGPDGPIGAGYSLDCFPSAAKSTGSSGSSQPVVETTGMTQLPADLSCGGASPALMCPCRVCSNGAATACSTDALCGEGSCSSSGLTGESRPNACEDGLCSGLGGDEGGCTTGPDDRFCDAVVEASGQGILPCASDEDCLEAAIGIDGGTCSLVQRRACFLDPVVASGSADPQTPRSAAAYCWSTLSTAGRTAAFGLPGPARVHRQTELRSWCQGAGTKLYVPGSKGCLP